MYSLTQALTFGGGIAIVLMGVRMILSELVPAFQGIALKIVPNALRALDCPTTFTFCSDCRPRRIYLEPRRGHCRHVPHGAIRPRIDHPWYGSTLF